MDGSTVVGITAGTEAGHKEHRMTVKGKIREALEGVADQVRISRDGKVTAKRMYFYRHGATADSFTQQVQAAMAGIGIAGRVRIERSEDCWNPWPRDSYFVTEFYVEQDQ